MGNIHRHTVQCVLVVNMLTEKIFLFLWLWLLLLSFGTAINMVIWTLSLSLAEWRHAFVTKFLECESNQTHRFVHHFLRPDGVLILHVCFYQPENLPNKLQFCIIEYYLIFDFI